MHSNNNNKKLVFFSSNDDSLEKNNNTNGINKKETNNKPDIVNKSPKKNNLQKILKWISFLLLSVLIFYGIWWISTDHYIRVSPNSFTSSFDKNKEIQLGVLDKGNERTLTASSDSLTLQYYIVNNNQNIYYAYLQTHEWGKIQFTIIDYSLIGKINVKEGETKVELEATQHRLSIGSSNFWFAMTSTETFKYEPSNIWKKITNDDSDKKLINALNDRITNAVIPTSNNLWNIILQILPTLIIVGLFVWYFSKMSKLQGGDGESIWSVGKSQAKVAKSNVKFTNVAGLQEEKAELIEIVDYLKNPNKYAAMGARAPKGVILYGPPGTGKTLLAKAVAGEAKVPFFQASGSSFEDMLVGVGAKRVRNLFDNAKKAAPSIIFIDEFDSVAAKRGKLDIAGGPAGIADQTINQLLAEMDGFNTKSGIVIIAATNRLDVLDQAILRPGRFDRHIQINLPDIKEREEILRLHTKNKNLSSKIVLNDIARRTPGFSGAQLENVLNEATLLAVRHNKNVVSLSDIDEAIDRVVAGPAKYTRIITDDEKKQIAYHEAGHALVGLHISGSDIVEKITIIPRGQAAGYTIATPEKQELSIQKKSDLLAIICSTLAGRAAEEVIYGAESISTGAANDLYKVTNITRAMVTQLGMTSLGMTQFIPSEGMRNPYLNQFSESTAQKIDKEVENIIQKQFTRAKEIIKSNKKELELIVTSLLVLETIVKSQIDYIHKNKKLPPEVTEKINISKKGQKSKIDSK